MATLLQDKYEARKAEVNARFEQLRTNEKELNRIFAKIYNMEGEVPIEVEDKFVSVARIFDTADEIPESYKGNKYVRTKRDEITSLISYAVGCMFGRYSLMWTDWSWPIRAPRSTTICQRCLIPRT